MSEIIKFSYDQRKCHRKILTHRMFRVFQQSFLLIVLLMGVGFVSLLLSSLTFAQNSKPFELRSGVIVDPVRNLVYVMNPKNGIDALDVGKGTLVWSTDQAAKPLALNGDRLICQVETKSPGNDLEIAILNVQERGQRVTANSIKLPDNVRITINETLNSSFHTYGRIQDDELIVAWKYSYRPIRGIPPDPKRVKKEQADQDSDKPKITKGFIKLDLASGEMSMIREEDIRISLVPSSPNLAAQERIADLKGTQFISADNVHVMTSHRVADDSFWDKYRWMIYKRATGERIAEIKNHRSYTPFFLFNSFIVYETGLYMRRIDKKMVTEPLKIRAFNLQTGEELWSWEIRDTKYRGPFPG